MSFDSRSITGSKLSYI